MISTNTKASIIISSILLTCTIDDLTQGVVYERSVDGGPWVWRGWSTEICEFADEAERSSCWRAIAVGFDWQRSDPSVPFCLEPECHTQ